MDGVEEAEADLAVQPCQRGRQAGIAPRWRGDAKELFYLKIDGSVMAVDVDVNRGATPGAATRLFTLPGAFHEWGVDRDGRRFLFAVPTAPPSPLQIVQNWQSLLPD